MSTKRLDKKNVQDIVALSPMQEGMLFRYLNNPDSQQYFEQLSLNISGNIDPKIIKQSWNFVTQTNEMLRTVFRWEKIETPAQITLKQHDVTFKEYDFSHFDDNQKKRLLEKVKNDDRCEHFDLTNVPFRIALCKLAENNYEMMVSNHHILYDGWSNGILLKEFQQTYETLIKGKVPTEIQKNKFKEFIKWNRVQDKDIQKNFWTEYLKDFETKTPLPTDMKKHGNIGRAEKCKYSFSIEWTERMTAFAQENNITMATLLYSVWGILLKRYNDVEVVVFGTTVSGRSGNIKGSNSSDPAF